MSDLIRKTVRGSSWLFIANVFGKISHFLIVMVLIRGLGIDEYGLILTVWGFAQMFAGGLDLGMAQVLLREGSRCNDVIPVLLRYILRVRLPLSIVLAIFVCLAAEWTITASDDSRVSERLLLYFLLSLHPIVDSWHFPFGFICHINSKFRLVAVYRLAYTVLLLMGVSLAVLTTQSVQSVALVYVGITALTTAAFAFWCRRFIPEVESNDWSFWSALQQGFPFLIIGILMMAYMRIELIVLSSTHSTFESGVYGAQYQIILLFFILPSLIYQTIMPHLYRNTDHTAVIRDAFTKLCRYLNLYGVLSAIFVYLLAADLLHIIGNVELASQSAGLKILSFMLLFMFSTATLNIMNSLDLLRLRILFEGIGLGLLLIAGLFVAKSYAVEGIAVLAVITYAVTAALSVACLYRRGVVALRDIGSDLAKIVIAAAAAVTVVAQFSLNEWLSFGLILLLSLGLLTAMRFWNETDLAVVRSYLSFVGKAQ